MSRYFLSSCAEADMLEVWEFIAENSISTADRMIDRFTAVFERIAQFPKSGAPYEHPRGEFRFVVVAPYLVFYLVVGGDVNIVRVLHSARRWETLL